MHRRQSKSPSHAKRPSISQAEAHRPGVSHGHAAPRLVRGTRPTREQVQWLAPLPAARTAPPSSRASAVQRKKRDAEANDGTPAFFAQTSAEYDASVARGRARWASLLTQLDTYHNDRERLVAELGQLRDGYAATWAEHYQTQYVADPVNRGTTEARTVGAQDLSAPPEKSKPDYFNKFDPANDTIRALANYGTADEARNNNQGLPNSEVLWRQYFDVVRSQLWVDKERRVLAKMGRLERLTREEVTTPLTRRVIWFCYPDGERWAAPMTWTPDDEEFMAILGTPNVGAAVFMLIDHVDELGGKWIESIETNPNFLIDVRFGAPPSADEVFRLRVDVLAAIDTARALADAEDFDTDLRRDNPLMAD